MVIFDGKKEAEKILFQLKKNIKKEKTKPSLVVVSVGENPASELFIRNKKVAAKKVGIRILEYKFKKNARREEILKKIKDLNLDSSVNGIIVQLPLSEGLDAKKITAKIHPKKDVDGFHPKTRFSPPLISAIFLALKKAAKNLQGKKIIALVNSDFFGQTLKKFLARKKIKIDFLLRKQFPQTEIEPKLKLANVIISICGCPNFIKGKMVKKGVILIDGGITVLARRKVVGDVNRKSITKNASFLTPVPGGIGPLTVALLLKNVYLAKKHERNS